VAVAAGVESPFARSRNAIRTLLDLDEHFGRAKLGGGEAGWKAMPGWMSGAAGGQTTTATTTTNESA